MFGSRFKESRLKHHIFDMKLISQRLQVRLSGGWMEMDDAQVSRVSWNLVKATEKGKSIANL